MHSKFAARDPLCVHRIWVRGGTRKRGGCHTQLSTEQHVAQAKPQAGTYRGYDKQNRQPLCKQASCPQ